MGFRLGRAFPAVCEDLAGSGGRDLRAAVKFGGEYAHRLKRREGRLGDSWYLDEMFVKIQGRQMYLWRAVISS